MCISSSDEEEEDGTGPLEQVEESLRMIKAMTTKCERQLTQLRKVQDEQMTRLREEQMRRSQCQITRSHDSGIWGVKKVVSTRGEFVLVEWEPTWIKATELCMP